MPPSSHESIIGLPNYKIISYCGTKTVEITAEYTGLIGCIHCGSVNLRKKERFNRVLKHHSIGLAKSVLIIQTHKFYCRYYRKYIQREFNEHKNASCPKVLGIDEKKFNKKLGYQTTLVNLQKHTVFDITLGRTESNLGKYLRRMPDRSNCKVIVMDLSDTYRKIARDYFPKAMIVADRFPVVRLVNHHFLKTWSLLNEININQSL